MATIHKPIKSLADGAAVVWFKLTTHRDCSWCRKRLRFAPLAFLFRINITHTICPTCKDSLASSGWGLGSGKTPQTQDAKPQTQS